MRILRDFCTILLSYIKINLLFFLVGFYILFSSILNILSGIDIGIPCLWKTIFGVECLSCGMTHAFIHLLKLEFTQALQSNKLIIIVFPAALIYFVLDFKKYWKKYKQTHVEFSKIKDSK